MTRILAEKSESGLSPSHSFCRCTTFWRGTAGGRQLSLRFLAQVARLNGNVYQIKLPFKGFYNPPYLVTLPSIPREPEIGIELDQHC